MKEIADLLKETRLESGIELDEVSKDLEIDEVVLKNIEEGKIGFFKDIFVLKDYISNYSKYLGLDYEKINTEFNEYLFEYTSKIPVNDIEKAIKENNKLEDNNQIYSPYTHSKEKKNKWLYIIIFILALILILFAIIWSINQITVEKRNAYIVSYRK